MPSYRSSPLRDQLSALLLEGDQTLKHRHDRSTAGLDAADRTDPGFRIEKPQQATGASDEEDGDAAGEVTASKDGERTKLYIYSEIGGWFGVWPEEVVAALAEIKGDVELHLHSPGGDAFDGVAIYNALRDHPGKIIGMVDGYACSAASIIAMACDELTMKRGSQMMIHDAWGYAVGPEEDLVKTAKFLGKVSKATADIYAAKAGGTADEWRAAMKEESWYTDREAVEAGLADKIETSQAAAKSAWDLRVFQHAGRENAPAPAMPGGKHPLAGAYVGGSPFVDLEALERMAAEEAASPELRSGTAAMRTGKDVAHAEVVALMAAAAQRARDRSTDSVEAVENDAPIKMTPVAAGPADGSPHMKGADGMPDRKKILEALGLGPDATDEQAKEAWAAAFAPPTAPAQAPTPPAEPGNPPNLSRLASMAKEAGVTIIDPYQLAAMQRMAEEGRQAYQKQRADERDSVIQKAVEVGKIEPVRVEYWQKKWDADPEGTREVLDGLAPNLIPMQPAGYQGTVAANEAESRLFALYPEMKPQGGGHRG